MPQYTITTFGELQLQYTTLQEFMGGQHTECFGLIKEAIFIDGLGGDYRELR